MTLDEYLKQKNIRDADFGVKIGKDRTSVQRYRRGVVTPPLKVIAAIEKVTGKAVSFRDFLGSAQ